MQINVDLIYPIGSLYLTTSTISPEILFGGKWEKITNDAYLKIASKDTAGNLGGTSSDHKIPITSIPSHNHSSVYSSSSGTTEAGASYNGIAFVLGRKVDQSGRLISTSSKGGGQAYYPYYYDVFVWKRIA